jgi:acetoin utilization deacetylase AcuC-like enzyme
MAEALLALGVPVGVVLEGGYALDALASSVGATMEVLAAGGGSAGELGDPELAAAPREYFSRWWPALA